jgi:TolB protein
MSRRDGNWEVYVMNADGSGQRRLTRNAAADASPAWSPDGRKIAFVRNRGAPCYAPVCLSNSGIYVMNADGTGQRRLARNAGWVWSPDGREIAYLSSATPACGHLRDERRRVACRT